MGVRDFRILNEERPMDTEVLDNLFTGPSVRETSRPPSPVPAVEEHVYLIGGTPFEEYRDFLLKERPEYYRSRIPEIADEWRVAAVTMLQYRINEPAWADNPPVCPVPAEMERLVALVQSDPIYQKAFANVRAELGWVELDRLVVRQNLLNLAHVARLKQGLGPCPSAEEIFRLCMPFDHITPQHRARSGPNSFTFVSDSNDIRFLEAVVLRPEQVKDYQAHGPVVGIVGIVVGYGSNYLNVIAAENRLVLHNGCHRAYALRELGITHVPCVIQRVVDRKELDAVATGKLRRNPDAYLKDPRPPVLKDFFDPALRKTVPLARTVRQVKVRFTTEMTDVPRP
jgi:hypothetical protein